MGKPGSLTLLNSGGTRQCGVEQGSGEGGREDTGPRWEPKEEGTSSLSDLWQTSVPRVKARLGSHVGWQRLGAGRASDSPPENLSPPPSLSLPLHSKRLALHPMLTLCPLAYTPYPVTFAPLDSPVGVSAGGFQET